ncbi:MAG TPA: hypothetical protein DD381_01775 [Lentisphaeria bacterium]|nr:MAG: hypothetical protein A2X47_10255 [Lentisphaerae bacterium GWF2_38_69]HBM15071.1 hypothetical protein [Lentisphaeria bacterium]
MENEALASYFQQGEKKEKDFCQGIEWELFVVDSESFKQIPYDGKHGVADLLRKLGKELKLEPKLDKVNSSLIGLSNSNYSITLEPGGQIELSGSKFKKLKDAEKECRMFLGVLKDVCRKWKLSVMPAPYHPLAKVEEIPTIPKTRYAFLEKYFQLYGLSLAEHMTKLTASIQTSIDFSSEADFVKKLRVINLISPILSAIYANSPIVRNKKSSYISYRGNVWQHTEGIRSGLVKGIFSESFGYREHAENLARLPVVEGLNGEKPGTLVGMSFKKYVEKTGRFLPKWWENHISFAYTVVRAKKFIEIRCFDNQNSIERALSIPALIKGLFYSSEEIIDGAAAISEKFESSDFFQIKHAVDRYGLATIWKGSSILEMAQEIYSLSLKGLEEFHPKETKYLQPVGEILFVDKKSPGQRVADFWERRGKSVYNMKDIYFI